MTNFNSKHELVEGFAKINAARIAAASGEKFADALATARILGEMKASYNPMFYRGGWVIEGFGYSTERIGTFVTTEESGIQEVA